jgi:hypothetical protein
LLFLVGVVIFQTALVAAVSGCGSTIVLEDPSDLDAGADGRKDAGHGGGGFKPDAGKDGFDEYVDPGCPDATPVPPSFQCDPYHQFNGDCAAGEGCYIFVDYPSEPCGQEVYGAICAPAGFGQQGDICSGGLDCGAGLVCVVTGSGTQCVELCPLSGNDDCPSGFVCEPIDVEGFGGCL